MNDERDHGNDEELQELLEGGLPDAERAALERRVRGSPEDAARLERMRKLDALLAEAVPEDWPAHMTDQVMSHLDISPRRGRVRRLSGLLTAAAAACLLALWGRPVFGDFGAAANWVARAGEGLIETLGVRPAFVPEVPFSPAAAVALTLVIAAILGGALGARRPGRVESHG